MDGQTDIVTPGAPVGAKKELDTNQKYDTVQCKLNADLDGFRNIGRGRYIKIKLWVVFYQELMEGRVLNTFK